MKREVYFAIFVEDDKWYYYKDVFPVDKFDKLKNGYVGYEVVVENGIITSDTYDYTNLGKEFSKTNTIYGKALNN